MDKRGFNLVEIMIATAVSGVLIVIVCSIAVIAFVQTSNLKDRLAAEENLNKIELYFKSTLGQAIDIDATDMGAIVSPFSVPGWTGSLVGNFVYDQIADSAQWTTLGYFYREIGGSGNQADATELAGGTLRPTAIFYRRPETNTSGVLFFNGGDMNLLTPNYSDRYVDRISYLEMQKNVNANYNKVTSVRIRVAVRYHDSTVSFRTWCPVADLAAGTAGCNQDAKYRDLDREFTVVIRNNLMKASGVPGLNGGTAEERTMGNLYFFRLVNPIRE